MKRPKWKYLHETKKRPRKWKLNRVTIRRAITAHRPYEVYLRDRYITHRDSLDFAKRVGEIINRG